jgi:hypothetical protein
MFVIIKLANCLNALKKIKTIIDHPSLIWLLIMSFINISRVHNYIFLKRSETPHTQE